MNNPSFIGQKTLIAIAALTLLGPTLRAQDSIPLEEARKAARKLAASVATLADAPFAVDPDLEKPQGIKAEGVGVIVLPDRKLSAELLAAANSAITPVGQLWTLKLNVAAEGKATATDKLRLVTITDGEKEREVQLYFLGATKSTKGELELVIYAKDKEPLLRVPLTSREGAKAEFPIEVSGEKRDEDSGMLSLRLFGQYRAEILLLRQE